MLGWTWGHAEWRRLDYGLGYAGSVDVGEGVFVIGMSGNACVGQSQEWLVVTEREVVGWRVVDGR